MKKIKIYFISFGSYIKLFIFLSAALGVFIGIISFLGSLVGAPVETHFLSMVYQGLPAGILSIVLAPFALGLTGILGGIVSYLPFKFLLRFINGLSIKGDFR
ncbi:hypothetical protein [Halothermothrix orenii]|uniref:hypothetical protein n=1 Tax=Halothermothrix orenii TaxID=31909 RepID=UPI00006B0919|nr:hypothetical protein [Halothermothrix orenii]